MIFATNLSNPTYNRDHSQEMPVTIYNNAHGQFTYESVHTRTQVLNFSFSIIAPNIVKFPSRKREGERRLLVEAEQTQQQPATVEYSREFSASYFDFGDYMERNQTEMNQAPIARRERE